MAVEEADVVLVLVIIGFKFFLGTLTLLFNSFLTFLAGASMMVSGPTRGRRRGRGGVRRRAGRPRARRMTRRAGSRSSSGSRRRGGRRGRGRGRAASAENEDASE